MIKKIKTRAIIILSILLIISISIIIISNSLHKKRVTNLIKDNDQIILNYEKNKKLLEEEIKTRKERIKEVDKTKSKTKKEVIYKKIIKKDTKIINDCIKEKEILKTQLDKTNNNLKNIKYSKNSLTFFTLFGIDQKFEFDLYTGLIYQRALYTNNNINLFIGGGGAVKIYEQKGGAAIFQFSIHF